LSAPEGPFRFARALQLFPTVVFQHGLVGAEALNGALLAEIEAMRRSAPSPAGSDAPWQSAPDLHEREAFRPLTEAVDTAIRVANQGLRYEVDGFRITGMWATWLRAGEHHPVHAHANNFWSGVYYVRSDGPRRAGLTFLHPNPAARVLLPKVAALTPSNSTSWSLDAEPGTMIVFPSWLQHHVPPVRDGERVSVAFNVLLTGDLLRPESLQHARIG
jgi:uncharacterized protein (TIGR02466 family)